MGERSRRLVAQSKLLEATVMVELDLDRVEFLMTEGDVANLSVGEQKPSLMAARIVITQAVNADYGGGMDRRDGQLWAGWQEVLAGTESRFSITQGQVKWVSNVLAKEDLKLPPGLAQWREALVSYLEDTAHVVGVVPAVVNDGRV